MRIRAFEYILGTLLSVIWTAIIWILLIGKLATNGFDNFIVHYTNWSWTLSGFFFIIDAISAVCCYRFMMVWNISILFWFTSGTAWLVFWLMFVVLWDNPEVVLREGTQFGGKYPLGFVFDMERVFHVLPAVVFIFYAYLRRGFIRTSVRQFFSEDLSSKWAMLLYGLVSIGIAPILALFYFLTQDVNAIYFIDVNPWIFVGVGIASIIVCNILPLVSFVIQIRSSKAVMKTTSEKRRNGKPIAIDIQK